MRRGLIVVIVGVVVLLCGVPGLAYMLIDFNALSKPAIQPVEVESGRASVIDVSLRASTNCADVGEEVTFTVRVANLQDQPLQLVANPPFDIIIEPYQGGAGPTIRWSESDQYPATIDPVLAPREVRTFEWRWIADVVYDPLTTAGASGTQVLVPISVINSNGMPEIASDIKLIVGVGFHPEAGNNGIICSDMRR